MDAPLSASGSNTPPRMGWGDRLPQPGAGAAFLVVHGECASKANSRQPAPRKSNAGKPFVAFIKSPKALAFVDAVKAQVRPLARPLVGELTAYIQIFYANQRPDLDESLVLDALQGLVYANDRQVRTRIVDHGIDKENPRVEIAIEPRYGRLL